MPFSDRPRRRLAPRGAGRRSVVSAIRPDAIDPSFFFGGVSGVGPDRKTLQLCRQAARALQTAIAGDAYVDTVEPAPDASRLLVTVRLFRAECDPDEVLALLNAEKPRLRAIVAEAITRKRTPELLFVVAGAVEVS